MYKQDMGKDIDFSVNRRIKLLREKLGINQRDLTFWRIEILL
jgi:hypothetical protein